MSGMRGRLLLPFFIAFKTMRKKKEEVIKMETGTRSFSLSFSPHLLNGFTAFTNIN
jgi:hypothetical protein